MSGKPPPDGPPLRLNPFAFPSSTGITFLLFLATLFGSSLFAYNAIYYSLPFSQEYTFSIYRQCSSFQEEIIPTQDIGGLVDNLRSFGQCAAPAAYTRLAWIAAGVALVFALAGLIYWIYPLWRIRSPRFVNLGKGMLPDMRQYLSELCQNKGLAAQPTFLGNPLNLTRNAYTLGHFRNYSIILNGTLLKDYYTDRSGFRSVVLHEIAHIKNSDVDKTYFTISGGLAFTVGALLPLFAVLLIFEQPVLDIIHVAWRMVLLSLFLYLTGTAVLRSRELYADVRASIWDGPQAALSAKFEPSDSAPTKSLGRRVFQFYPSHAERLRAIHAPHTLLKTGVWEMFCAGVAAAVAYHNIFAPLLLPVVSFISFVPDSLFGALWIYGPILISQALSLVFAPMILSVGGAAIWQKRFRELAGYSSPDLTIPMSVSLAAGFLVGYKISLLSIGFSTSTSLLGPSIAETELPVLKGMSLFLFDFSWTVVLAAGLIFLLRWFTDGVSVWMDVAIARRSPRPVYLLSLVLGGLLLSCWLGILLYLYWILSGSGSDLLGVANLSTSQFGGAQLPEAFMPVLIVSGLFGLTIMNPASFLGIILLWLFPLLAWFWADRKTSKTISNWAFLPSTSGPAVRAELRPPVQPVLALVIGMAGAVLFFAYILIGLLLLRYILPVSETMVALFVISCLLMIVVMQVGAGVTTALWVRRLGVWHAMFATFVTGCCILVAYFVVTFGFGVLPPLLSGLDPSYTFLSEVFFLTGIIINLGQLVMIPFAILISLGRYLISKISA